MLGVLFVALLAAAIIKGNSKPKGTKVSVEAAQKRSIKETVSASGKMYPEVEVKISSDVSGEIVELYVAEGDTVKQGQLLAKIDPDAYQSGLERTEASLNQTRAQLSNARAGVKSSEAQVEQSKGQLSQVEAQLANQKAIYQRNLQLFKDGIVSQSDLDAAQAQLRVYEGNLASAQAALRSALAGVEASNQQVNAGEFSVKASEASLKESRTNLKRTSIYAPMNGIVSLLNVEKGERVVGTAQMSGTELMRIANFNFMEVQVDVSENDVLRVARGNSVEIEVDAYADRKFSGHVTHIANSASNVASSSSSDQITNFLVKVRVDADTYQDLMQKGKRFPFRPGMSASVEINTRTVRDVLCVPIQSVTVRENKEKKEQLELAHKEDAPESATNEALEEVVFVVQADTVSMVKVKTGVQDDTYIEILSGMQAGDKAVSGPYTAISKDLSPGDRVEVVDKDKLFADESKDK